MPYQEITKFWFETLSPKDWWVKNPQLDAQIAQQFGEVHQRAADSELKDWREYDQGRLAEIIVLDQFSRNMFRGAPGAFAYDSLALACCKEALDAGAHTRLPQGECNFLLMPIMHSESLHEHQTGLPYFEQFASPETLKFEQRHRAIVEQFGRYPHRNEILGRPSTEVEITFLKSPGSSF